MTLIPEPSSVDTFEVSVIFESRILLATKVKPVTTKEDNGAIDASTGVVLQLDDTSQLTIEVNSLTIMISLDDDSTIQCIPIRLMVNSLVPNTINNTCRI